MKTYSKISIVLLALSACAHLQPASLPSSVPTEYVMVMPGDVVPAPGFYLSEPGARAVLKSIRLHDLDLEEQLAEAQYQRDADVKALQRENFWAKWGVWVGGAIAGVLGGFVGYEIGHH